MLNIKKMGFLKARSVEYDGGTKQPKYKCQEGVLGVWWNLSHPKGYKYFRPQESMEYLVSRGHGWEDIKQITIKKELPD